MSWAYIRRTKPMPRYSWSIKPAESATGDAPLAVYLALHGLRAATPEIKLSSREYADATAEAGFLDVEEDLGELQTGSLRADFSTPTPWPVEWVRIVDLSDGRTWTALGGVCEPEGVCPLLRFEKTRRPMARCILAKEPTPLFRPAVRTYEIFGMQHGRVVPLTQVLRIAAGVKTLRPGSRVWITASESQGFGLAGAPGRWAELYPDEDPAAHGLDSDKPVLASDGTRGWVLDAHYLAMLFGADWRRVVYENEPRP